MSPYYTAFGLKIYQQQANEIKKLQQQYPVSLHGDRLWDSSFLLMSYLEEARLDKNSRILDLGCGWGLLSFYLLRNGYQQVTALDGDKNVFAYMQAHADLNQLSMPNTLVADFSSLNHKDLADYDVILAADVCFWDEMADIQAELIDNAIHAGVETIIYSDPMRPPFHQLAYYCCEQHFADAFEYEIECDDLAAAGIETAIRGAIMCIENA